MGKDTDSIAGTLTSDAFDGAVASEARRTRARLEVVDGRAFGVHSAGVWLSARVDALAARADLVQRAFLVQRAGRLADAGIAVRVGRTVG